MIYLNGQLIPFSKYPNGETKVDDIVIRHAATRVQGNRLQFKYAEDGDLIQLMFVKRYLDTINPLNCTNLEILYMPYSRMDRVENSGVLTLKDVAWHINSLNFYKVNVIEPHSDVTLALLDRATATYPTQQLLPSVLKMIDFDLDHDRLFYPDAGAAKRYSKMNTGYKYLTGNKSRNFDNGHIESLEILGNLGEVGGKVLIVDDLCSYGNTFIKSATALERAGFAEIYLFITHSEYSIFKGAIFDSLINKVFTTNSMLNEGVDVNEYNIDPANKHKLHIFDIVGSVWE